MKTGLAIAGAGGTFAATVVAGLLLGIWLDNRQHTGYWTLVLFFGGIVLGGYAAWRLVARTFSS